MSDPYHVHLATTDLSRLGPALDVLDRHAELNHRYRKLIEDSRQALAADEVRLTQARGIAKKLLVLVKASGPEFRDALGGSAREALDAGLAQADNLLHQHTFE